MAIFTEPNERIIAFRIDGGPRCFDEGPLKLWRVVGPIVEVPGNWNGTAPGQSSEGSISRFFKDLLRLGA